MDTTRMTRGPHLGASQNLGLHSARPEVIVLVADAKTMERSLTDVPAVARYLYGVPPLRKGSAGPLTGRRSV